MFDPATMALLAKIKVLAKRKGTNIDLVKMSGDRTYAELILKELSNADDTELVLIAIQLMNQFGMLGTPEGQPDKEEKSAGERYVGSLR